MRRVVVEAVKLGDRVRLYDTRDGDYKEIRPTTEDGLEVLAIGSDQDGKDRYIELYLEQGFRLQIYRPGPEGS